MDNHMKSVYVSLSSFMLPVFPFIFVGLFTFSQSTLSSRNASYSDEQALLDFKAAVTFAPYNSLANWSPNTSFCKWAGISCSPPSTQIRVVRMNLSSMGLEGTISSMLGNLSALQWLDLSHNQLQGSIPPDLGFLPRLEFLYLGGNSLTGRIPYAIGNLSSLVYLQLSSNFVNGIIPGELGMLTKLKLLDLHDNRLSGIIPYFIVNFSSLTELDLAKNDFTGTIPPCIGNLFPSLTLLDLSYNLLSGHIPPGIGRLHKLEELDLSSNILEGRIPEEIGQMQSLWLLAGSYNKLSGRIPASLGKLDQLRIIFLDNNHFTGEIPRCPYIELLDLSHNNLTGRIPGAVMVSLTNLKVYLNLSCNFLQGPLPREISKIEMVQAIDLSHNQLDGEIPAALGNCTSLMYLNLSHNTFQGPIPAALSILQNLEDIDLSCNKLDGEIPDLLSNSRLLVSLNLSHNIFQGPIPGALSELQNLKDIDLSYNCLSGSIPTSFGQMRMLRYMNFSFYNLTGPRKYLLSACVKAKEGRGKKSSLRNKLVAAVGVIAFILLFSILALLWRRKFSRQQPHIPTLMLEKIRYPKFSYHDIFIATNGFNEENLLGVGNFGSVFKGTLEDGRVVAIKFLHFQGKEGERSFKIECKVLGRIRHRNVIRVISAFSYLNIKALVLQFACNGSLEKHLYPESDEEEFCRLGFNECLNIAIDVTHGMEYLHHDCSMKVVHCDLKPSNVLLDGDMTALVSDFGISRLTNFADFMDSLGTSCAARGTIGYIAPEYGLGENVSIKGDVYSYGILLLEMITRKRPTDTSFVGDLNLRSWVKSAFPNSLIDVVDNQLLRNLPMEQHGCLISLIDVGLICSHEAPQYRPSMRDVGRALEGIRATFMGSGTATSYLRIPILNLLSAPSTSHAPDEAMSESQSSTF